MGKYELEYAEIPCYDVMRSSMLQINTLVYTTLSLLVCCIKDVD